MPSAAAWFASNEHVSVPLSVLQLRAEKTWAKINDNPTTVAFETAAGDDVPSQTVRFDWDNDVSVATSAAGSAPLRDLIMLGVKGHATEADSDVRVGYTFNLDKKSYRCVQVIPQIGQVEAKFEALG